MLHLFHPAFVHFSIALLVVGGCAEAWGCLRAREAAVRLGGVLTLAGTLSLLPTIVTGYLAANTVPIPGAAAGDFALHEATGWAVLGLFVGLLFWKAWNRGTVPPAQRPFYGAALLLGVVMVAVGGLLGGELVFAHAVGVAR